MTDGQAVPPPADRDELDDYVAHKLASDPVFAAAYEAAERYAVNFPAELVAAVAKAVHLEPDQSWVSDEACAAAALEALSPHMDAIAAQAAAAGRAEEREACARLAEQEAAAYGDDTSTAESALAEFAELIRARTTP